jgi:hypothetical protein
VTTVKALLACIGTLEGEGVGSPVGKYKGTMEFEGKMLKRGWSGNSD